MWHWNMHLEMYKFSPRHLVLLGVLALFVCCLTHKLFGSMDKLSARKHIHKVHWLSTKLGKFFGDC